MNFEVAYEEIKILGVARIVVLIRVFNVLRIVQDYYAVKL